MFRYYPGMCLRRLDKTPLKTAGPPDLTPDIEAGALTYWP